MLRFFPFIVVLLVLPACKKKTDNQPPTITLNGLYIDQAYVRSTYVDPGATAKDLDAYGNENDVTPLITQTDDIDSTLAGEYRIKYNVSDKDGNPAPEAVRTVHYRHHGGSLSGIYSVTRSCPGVSDVSFPDSIYATTDKIIIYTVNFDNDSNKIFMGLGGTHNKDIFLPQQSSPYHTFWGSGTAESNGKTITLNYFKSDGIDTLTCTLKFVR